MAKIHGATINQKWQVTIPAPIRKAMQIKPKDTLLLKVVDGELRIKRSRIIDGYGAVKPIKPIKYPIDFKKLRREIQEEIAEESIKRGHLADI